MAWAVYLDGTNEYLKAGSPFDFTGDFYFRLECDISNATTEGFLELSTNTNNFFGKLNNNTWYCRMAGSTVTFNYAPPANTKPNGKLFVRIPFGIDFSVEIV